jgi:replicative DNA helicase
MSEYIINKQKIDFNNFDEEFQLSIIKYFLEDIVFFKSVLDLMKVQYFTYNYHREILTIIIEFFAQYKRIPSFLELKTICDHAKHFADKDTVITTINAIPLISNYAKDFVVTEVVGFFKTQELVNAITKNLHILNKKFNQEEHDKFFEDIKNAYTSCQTDELGHDYKKDIALRYITEHNSQFNVAATGFSELDGLTQGGTDFGEISMIKGGSGIGKTSFLINIGYYNVVAGKNVWHVTLELPAKYVGRRYDCRHTLQPFDVLFKEKSIIFEEIKNLKGNILIKRYPEYTITVDKLESEYEKLLSNNFVPDVLLLDYADLLLPHAKAYSVSSSELYNAMGRVYGKLRALGEKLKLPIWTASQINRSKEKGLLANMADSAKKAHFADLVVDWRRDNDQIANDTADLVIEKNRKGPANITIPFCNIDMGTCYLEVDTQKFMTDAKQNIKDTIFRNKENEDSVSLKEIVKKKPMEMAKMFSELRERYTQRDFEKE